MRRLTVTDVPALDLFYPCDDSTPQLLELLHACLDDFQPVAIHEHEGGNGWRVFFKTPDTRDGAARALTADFAGRLTSVSPADVPDDGWAARSQAKLGAVRIEQIVVAPPWETSAAKRGEILVVIEPSMGFGTGHHATTRLCLQLLQNVTVKGRRVIDVGTGSGVLAIAASRLGAATTVAVDCDPDALENARENIARNGVSGAIEVLEADLGVLDIESADIVVANLTSAVRQRYATSLDGLLRPDGTLIVSGFGPDELFAIQRAFGRSASTSLTDEAWCAAAFSSRLP
jgi:ribosomal protein L11 methyltransferase